MFLFPCYVGSFKEITDDFSEIKTYFIQNTLYRLPVELMVYDPFLYLWNAILFCYVLIKSLDSGLINYALDIIVSLAGSDPYPVTGT